MSRRRRSGIHVAPRPARTKSSSTRHVKRMRMKIPFAIGNSGPAGRARPQPSSRSGSRSRPGAACSIGCMAWAFCDVAQSGKTIEFGILSTDTGGAAAGFINGSSLAPTAPSNSSSAPMVRCSRPTRRTTDSETGGAANGLDISYTLSSGTTTAAGFILAAVHDALRLQQRCIRKSNGRAVAFGRFRHVHFFLHE